MNVHLFEAISSPGCSNYALKTTADDFEEDESAEAANVLTKNFYVDVAREFSKTFALVGTTTFMKY